MRYVLAVTTWGALSALWGLVGTAIGPGIIAFIIALIIGTVGSLITVAQYASRYAIGVLRTGLLVAMVSGLVVWLLISREGMTYLRALWLAAFVAIPSLLGSFVTNRLDINTARKT